MLPKYPHSTFLLTATPVVHESLSKVDKNNLRKTALMTRELEIC